MANVLCNYSYLKDRMISLLGLAGVLSVILFRNILKITCPEYFSAEYFKSLLNGTIMVLLSLFSYIKVLFLLLSEKRVCLCFVLINTGKQRCE